MADPGLPRGADLVRIRTELVGLTRQHAPGNLGEAERLLAAAVAALPRPMVQVELFVGAA